MPKYTEGEWYYSNGYLWSRSSDSGDGRMLAGVCMGYTRAEQKANGVLMASAPELLKYAHAYYDHLIDIIDDPEDWRCRIVDEMRELFDRIEGKENRDE